MRSEEETNDVIGDYEDRNDKKDFASGIEEDRKRLKHCRTEYRGDVISSGPDGSGKETTSATEINDVSEQKEE